MVTRQVEITSAAETTEGQLVQANRTLEEIKDVSDDQVQADSVEEKVDILNNVEEELVGLRASQKLLAELLLKVQEGAVAKAVAKAVAEKQTGSTTVTFGAQNSGFQAGVINGPISGLTFGGK